MNGLAKTLSLLILCLVTVSAVKAETLVNWDLGYEIEVPNHWLRADLGPDGTQLSYDDVKISIEPFSGITMQGQIERVHQFDKEEGWGFRSEKSFTINEVPAHEIIYERGGKYRVSYVLLSGQRGFLWTFTSEGTDSEAFMEGQKILYGFVVMPAKP